MSYGLVRSQLIVIFSIFSVLTFTYTAATQQENSGLTLQSLNVTLENITESLRQIQNDARALQRFVLSQQCEFFCLTPAEYSIL